MTARDGRRYPHEGVRVATIERARVRVPIAPRRTMVGSVAGAAAREARGRRASGWGDEATLDALVDELAGWMGIPGKGGKGAVKQPAPALLTG